MVGEVTNRLVFFEPAKQHTHCSFYLLCKDYGLNVIMINSVENLCESNAIIYEREVFSPENILKYNNIRDIIKGSNDIKDYIVDKLQKKKCLLLLNCAHEHFNVDLQVFVKLADLLKQDNISTDHVIITSNSISYSITKCYNITHVAFNYFEAAMRIEGKHTTFESAYNLRDENIKQKNLKKKFICLNRALRKHRIDFVYELWKRSLLENIACSMQHVTPQQYKEKKLRGLCISGYDSIKYQELSSILPLIVDTDNFLFHH